MISHSFNDIEIIFENKDYLVVNKPHNLAVIKGRNRDDKWTLYETLQRKYKNLFIVHRLDAATGGIMVFAKNQHTQKFLSNLFMNGEVYKEYLCICEGVLKNPLTLMLPISKVNNHGKYNINFKSGRKSITTFYPLYHNNKSSIVLALPKTGRTHQIRLHLKAIDVPLYYDYIYNKKDNISVIPLCLVCIAFEMCNIQNKTRNISL